MKSEIQENKQQLQVIEIEFKVDWNAEWEAVKWIMGWNSVAKTESNCTPVAGLWAPLASKSSHHKFGFFSSGEYVCKNV